MKNFYVTTIALAIAFASCNTSADADPQNQDSTATDSTVTVQAEKEISGQFKYNEGTFWYDGGLLISNFGSSTFDPLNSEGKGYISYYKNDSVTTFIPADGNLNGPKGIYVGNGYIYIADVGKVAVYKIGDSTTKPVNIQFPKEEVFVNDLASDGQTLYVSVVNTGNIYKIDISDPAKLTTVQPVKFSNVVGANGLVLDGSRLFVASYPADGKTTEANVVYVINDITNPLPEKFINTPGQYDGVALSADKKTMYITNWDPVQVAAVNMDTKQITPLTLTTPVESVADITLQNGTLYIPDLAGSKLVVKPLN